MNYLYGKKFMYQNVHFEENDAEKKKIYPIDEDKKDALESIIKEQINKEFHVMLQKDKFEDSDSAKVKEFVKNFIKEQKYFFQSKTDYEQFVDMIVNDIFGLGILESYIKDPTIQEIWVSGPKKIYFDRLGKREESPLKFKNSKVIVSMINKILATINRKADESTPIVDARLEDGSRVAITMPPVALNGPEITIRKFMNDKFTLQDYVRIKSASKSMAEFLANSVRWGANILVVGGTSTGKTTLLNALTNEIPNDRGEEHIITIEDSAEIKVYSPFVQSWETKNANSEGKGEIGSSLLVKHSLRNSPDRIILGEIRDGAVAYEVLQAVITGHKGTMSTIHAENAAKAVERFATLAGSAGVINANDAKELFGEAFDLIVVMERLINPNTGEACRVVTQVSHIVGVGLQGASKLNVKAVDDPSHVYLKDIYVLDKRTFNFKTTGYLPRDLITKAQLEHRDYDLTLFEKTN